jgi:hypothetical protein
LLKHTGRMGRKECNFGDGLLENTNFEDQKEEVGG